MRSIFPLITFFLFLFLSVAVAGQINRANTKKSVAYRASYQRLASGSTAPHTLEIRDGTLWACGLNDWGQLGIGSTDDKKTPIQVDATTKWAAAAAGHQHSLALKTDGTLWAWGKNHDGQLGVDDGTYLNRKTPAQIGSDTRWVSVAGGARHSLGLKADGTLWAWGRNREAQLGDGTFTEKTGPVQIGSDTKWVSISAGELHSLALKADGTLWGWGYNSNGQVGNAGEFGYSVNPTQIGSDAKWVSISAGVLHSLALKADGTVWAWGSNRLGQLGDGTTTDRNSPVQIGNDTKWVSVVASQDHSLGLKADGTLWAWGYNAVGDGSATTQKEPVQIGTDNKWVSITAGDRASYGLKADGTQWAWGENGYGQLGDGTRTPKFSPVQVSVVLTGWLTVKGGGNHTLGLKANGTIWGWGDNTSGALGDGTSIHRYNPVRIGNDNKWMSIAANGFYSLGLKGDGTLWAWGDNLDGQLGIGSTAPQGAPLQVGAENKWVSIAAGESHCLALKADGTLWAWGNNFYGQLGDGSSGSNANKTSPLQIGNDTRWVSIAAGSYHSLALKADGTLWAWGYNGVGQLGDGTKTDKHSPLQIGTETKWLSIAAGAIHSTAIKADGTLWAWGNNGEGELGDGSNTDRNSPVQTDSDTKWMVLAAGGFHNFSLKSDGTLWAWGYNSNGQLADGTTTDKNSPLQIGSENTWVSAAAGGRFSLVLKSGRSHFCASGQNSTGQLGDGTTVDKNSLTCNTDRVSSITNYFRSHQTGNWSDVTTWESSTVSDFSSGVVSPATLVPDYNASAVTVRSPHRVTVTADVTTDQTVVNSGGTLTVSSGIKLTINDGTGADIVVNGTANGTGNLTIKSTAAGTASVGNSGGTISVNTTVERYIPSKSARKYSFVSSPVNVTIRNAWQQQVFITGAGSGGSPCGSSTGNGTTSTDRYNTNGFDVTSSGAPSLFTYNATPVSGSRWVSLANTGFLLTPGIGYRVNVRGPRGVNDANCSNQLTSVSPSSPADVTLSVTGILVTGAYPVNVYGRTSYGATPANNAYTLIGNPYASEISTKTLQTGNSSVITTSFWYYSPQTASNAYSTYNTATQQAVNFPAGYTNGTVADVIIASGQSFFVERTADADANLTFQEGQKTTTGTVGNAFFRVQTNITDKLRIAYQSVSDNVLHDELYINYLDESGASLTDYTSFDTRSFSIGNTYSLASLKGNMNLTIQSRPHFHNTDTVRLSVAGNAGTFKYSFSEYTQFTSASQILLMDNYTGTSQNIKINPEYTFTINSDVLSRGNNRFMIVFRAANILPVDFITIKAQSKNNGVEVTWKVPAEVNMEHYDVERSSDGYNFEVKGTVSAKGNSNSTVSYNWTDNQLLTGMLYYRIKATNKSGESKYSPVAKVHAGRRAIIVSLFPNPVMEQLNVVVNNSVSSTLYSVRITDAKGVEIYRQAGLKVSNNLLKVNTSNYTSGVYLIEVTGDKGDRTIARFIK
jgi:alpha-tubulin suppressor-like RCC1 family protein